MLQLASNNRNNHTAFFLFPPTPIKPYGHMCCLYLYQMWYDLQHFYLALHQMWYSLQHFYLSLSQMCDYLQHFYLNLYQTYYYFQLMNPGGEKCFSQFVCQYGLTNKCFPCRKKCFNQSVFSIQSAYPIRNLLVRPATMQPRSSLIKKANCSIVWPHVWITRC